MSGRPKNKDVLVINKNHIFANVLLYMIMGANITVLFSRLSKMGKINFNILFLVLLFGLLGFGSFLYASWLEIRHQNEIVILKKYGPCEFLCDSIIVDLTIPLPTFEYNSWKNSELTFINNPDFYTLKTRSGITNTLLKRENKYKLLDSLTLSEKEILSIQDTFHNTIPNNMLKAFKGALLWETINYTNKASHRRIKQKKADVKKMKPSTGRNHQFWSRTDLSILNEIDTNHWKVSSNYLCRDSILYVDGSFEYNNKYQKDCFLIDIPFPGDILTISTKFNKRHKGIHKYDLSQEAINIDVNCDLSKYIKIRRIAIPFEAYPDFTYLFPEPDSVGEKEIFFVDSLKIDMIKSNGFHAFVKYPEKQSLQTARIFILTMILSLVVTGIVNQFIRLIKNIKIKRTFCSKTKMCAISAINCNDCPLKLNCEQFKNTQQ